MQHLPPCPKCQCEHTYFNGSLAVCPECFYEWGAEVEVEVKVKVEAEVKAEAKESVKDSNGNVLVNGDSVVVIKDLPVKGSSKSVKAGTKVKNIKLVEGDHNISCKIEGFGAMGLKSEFVRKA
jgi:protein PhnA